MIFWIIVLFIEIIAMLSVGGVHLSYYVNKWDFPPRKIYIEIFGIILFICLMCNYVFLPLFNCLFDFVKNNNKL